MIQLDATLSRRDNVDMNFSLAFQFLTSARHARQVYGRPILVRAHNIVRHCRSQVVQDSYVGGRHCGQETDRGTDYSSDNININGRSYLAQSNLS